MKQTAGLLARFNRLMPQGVTPRFSTAAEWQSWQQNEARKHCEEIITQNRQARLKRLMGRSGIRELHQRCTFNNYHVTCDGQRRACEAAKSWLARFQTSTGGFVFAGKPGTGKNHLAAAIGNALIAQGRSVLIATVADIMTQLRACYSGEGSEAEFLDGLCSVDLLVIDEVGVQRETQNERIVMNQIIDRRTASLRPVGMLTNLTPSELADLLGERIMDRLRMGNSLWLTFDWGSYRASAVCDRSNGYLKIRE